MRPGLAIYAFVLLVAAGLTIGREYRAVIESRVSPMTMFLGAVPDTARLPPSREGQYAVLRHCDRVMATRTGLLMPVTSRRPVYHYCGALAETALGRAPGLSIAHLLKAHALVRLDRDADAQPALIAAEATGGGLAWMATRRLDIAIMAFDSLGPAGRAVMQRDIGRLLESPSTRRALIRRYRSGSDALKSAIVEAVEALPERRQQDFVAALRRYG